MKFHEGIQKVENIIKGVEKTAKKAVLGTAILVAGSGTVLANEKETKIEKDNNITENINTDTISNNLDSAENTVNYLDVKLETPGEEKNNLEEVNYRQFFQNIIMNKEKKDVNFGNKVSRAAKEEPRLFLGRLKYFVGIPGFDSAKEISQAAEYEPKEFLFVAAYDYKNLKNIPGLDLNAEILKVAEKEPGAFLTCALDFKDIPGIDLNAQILKAAEKEAGTFLNVAKDLKGISGLDITAQIAKAFEKDSESFLDNAKDFKDIPELNLGKMISTAAKHKPAMLLYRAPSFVNIPGLDLEAEILKAAPKESWIFFQEIHNLEKVPGINLASIIVSVVEKRPSVLLDNISYFKNIPGLDLAKEIAKAAKRSPENFYKNINSFKDIPGLDLANIILLLADYDLESFAENSADLKGIEGLNSGPIILKLVEEKPKLLLRYYFSFKDIPGIDFASAISKAAAIRPSDFLQYAPNFQDIPGFDLKGEILKAAKDNNWALLTYYSILKDIPGLDLTLEIAEAVRKDPYTFLIRVNNFKELKNFNLLGEVLRAVQMYPAALLNHKQELTDVPGFDMAAEVKKASAKEPTAFLDNASDFKDVPGLDLGKMISAATKNDPMHFLFDAKYFKDISGLNLALEIPQAADKSPGSFLENAADYKDIAGLDLCKIISIAHQNDPRTFLTVAHHFKDIKGLNLAEKISQAMQKEPAMFIYNAENLKLVLEKSEYKLLLEKSFEMNPEAVNGYKLLLEEIDSPKLKSTQILKNLKDPKASVLLHDLVNNNLSEEEAIKIVNNPTDLLKALLKIKSAPNYLGKIDVQNVLGETCLKMVRVINDLHLSKKEDRFKSVQDLAPQELYNLMVYGEEEIFTSSFNGIFDLLKGKMAGKLDGKDLVGEVEKNQDDNNRFRTFVKECIGFNRFDEFMKLTDKSEANKLLAAVVKNIENADDKLEQGTVLAEIFGSVQDPKQLQILQDQLKLEYERLAATPGAKIEDKALYGFLTSIIKDKAVSDKEWFQKVAAEFPLVDVSELKSTELFNKDNINIQQYFFYNDEDGISSFKSFLSEYKNDSKWKITKEASYVVVSGEENGKKIEIYANYPEQEGNGTDSLDKFLQENKKEVVVFVHCGHSYHVGKTEERIKNRFLENKEIKPENVKIVSLRSCGGYNNIVNFLDIFPNAHILSTRGTGTRLLNDPIGKKINQVILSGQDVVWKKVWTELENSPLSKNKNFKDYVSPHKNLGVMYIKGYNKLKK
jgi:hypothetical protein